MKRSSFDPELFTWQWGLIPWFAKEPKLKYPTNNARSEDLEAKASYKDPWRRGQRCIIPRMHKPDPKLAPDKQDKRSVIPLEVQKFDTWLAGTVEEAQKLLKLGPVELFDARPIPA